MRFGERSITFLQDIYATDSLKRKAALSELRKSWGVSFQPGDFPMLKSAISNPGFDKLKFLERSILINAVGDTKSPDAIAWLRDFCDSRTDSARYQSLALGALATMKTKASFKTLFDIWLERPIYFGKDKSISFPGSTIRSNLLPLFCRN